MSCSSAIAWLRWNASTSARLTRDWSPARPSRPTTTMMIATSTSMMVAPDWRAMRRFMGRVLGGDGRAARAHLDATLVGELDVARRHLELHRCADRGEAAVAP